LNGHFSEIFEQIFDKGFLYSLNSPKKFACEWVAFFAFRKKVKTEKEFIFRFVSMLRFFSKKISQNGFQHFSKFKQNSFRFNKQLFRSDLRLVKFCPLFFFYRLRKLFDFGLFLKSGPKKLLFFDDFSFQDLRGR